MPSTSDRSSSSTAQQPESLGMRCKALHDSIAGVLVDSAELSVAKASAAAVEILRAFAGATFCMPKRAIVEELASTLRGAPDREPDALLPEPKPTRGALPAREWVKLLSEPGAAFAHAEIIRQRIRNRYGLEMSVGAVAAARFRLGQGFRIEPREEAALVQRMIRRQQRNRPTLREIADEVERLTGRPCVNPSALRDWCDSKGIKWSGPCANAKLSPHDFREAFESAGPRATCQEIADYVRKRFGVAISIDGVKKARERYGYRCQQGMLSKQQEATLKGMLERGPMLSHAEVSALIVEHFGVQVRHVGSLLHRLGIKRPPAGGAEHIAALRRGSEIAKEKRRQAFAALVRSLGSGLTVRQIAERLEQATGKKHDPRYLRERLKRCGVEVAPGRKSRNRSHSHAGASAR